MEEYSVSGGSFDLLSLCLGDRQITELHFHVSPVDFQN